MGNQHQKTHQQNLQLQKFFQNNTQLQKYKQNTFRLPDQSMPHQATWLQWPHPYQYGNTHSQKLDSIWIQFAKQLSSSQIVRIIAFDQNQKLRIQNLLPQNIKNIQYFIHQTDDVWIRDNGPIFIRDQKHKLIILNWGFDGWGKKADYQNCSLIPSLISKDIQMPLINLRKIMVLQGGSIQVDGQGVLVTTQSCTLNKNRNSNITKQQVQLLFKHFFGIKKIIWLKGKAGREITDMHIDEFFKFFDPSTIITMNQKDLRYWEVPTQDIEKIHNELKTLDDQKYKYVILPLTKNNVKSTNGKNLGKGSYVNFYVANTKILIPNYDDPNDNVAYQIIQKLYPHKKVVGIKINDLFQQGGMIHGVTLQQPIV